MMINLSQPNAPAHIFNCAQASITPLAPRGITDNLELAQMALARGLALQSGQLIANLAIVALANPAGDANGPRFDNYLHVSGVFDGQPTDLFTSAALPMLDALDNATLSSRRLSVHPFDIVPVVSGALRKRLGGEFEDLPLHTLEYVTWPESTDWLAPAHMQPIYDAMMRRMTPSVVLVGMSRIATRAGGREDRYYPYMLTCGLEHGSAAHKASENEFTGVGLLAPRRDNEPVRPVVRFRRVTQPAERASIIAGSARLPRSDAFDARGLSLREAAFLFPLPLPLYAVVDGAQPL